MALVGQQRDYLDCAITSTANIVCGLLFLGSVCPQSSHADELTESMRLSTVPVLCLESATSIKTGSGFIVAAGQHVVTNRHVVACADTGGKVVVISASGEVVQASVVLKANAKDLAILHVEKSLGEQR